MSETKLPKDPTRHVLKTAPDPWMAVRDGIKTAEFRRDDRGFEVGDWLDLRYITEDGASQIRRITHIVRGPQFGIPEGYAMLSFDDPIGASLLRTVQSEDSPPADLEDRVADYLLSVNRDDIRVGNAAATVIKMVRQAMERPRR